MTKLEKFLSKLVPKERFVIENILEKIVKLNLEGLDVKKLKNMEGIYRVRKGNIRIKFYVENRVAHILEIGRRSDNTY